MIRLLKNSICQLSLLIILSTIQRRKAEELRPQVFKLTYQSGNKICQFILKIQTAQEGHEADKHKELAGRIRASLYEFYTDKYGNYHFRKRTVQGKEIVPFIILDGDWPSDYIQNLHEAGFVGVYTMETLDRMINDIKNLQSKSIL